MPKFALVAAVASALLAPVMDQPESFGTVAHRLGASLLKGDWEAIRRDSAPCVTFEEHYAGHALYFSKDGAEVKPVLGSAANKSISFSTAITNKPTLSRVERKILSEYCKLMREASQYHSDGWGPWPRTNPDFGKHVLDSLTISGPCLEGTIASNIDVAVEMVRVGGKWKAHRFLVMGH